MRILVTGGAGYVGSVLVPMLLRLGHCVTVYDRLDFGIDPMLPNFINDGFKMIKGDIRNQKDLALACKNKDIVIHLASIVGFPACKKDENEALTVNVGGAEALAKVAGSASIIFSSTGSVYGDLSEVCTEAVSSKPVSLYGETKVMAENTLMQRGDCIIYRFATGYGISPRLRLDLMVNDFCYRAVKERNLVVYEKNVRRSFIHVWDMAKAFVHAVNNVKTMRNEVYNVGSETMNMTKEDVAEAVKKKCDYYLYYADFGTDEDKRDYKVSYGKIRKAGFETEIPFKMGVEQLLSLFRVFEQKSKYSNV